MSDDTGRPVALMTFAVLAVIGFIATVVLGARGSSAPAQPQQPDIAIAAEIEGELSSLSGVQAADVSNTVECVDDCNETRQKYLATVELRPDVTPQQISEVVSTHDMIAPSKVGMSAVPITLLLAPDKILSVASVHYGFGVTQADAYLTAASASAAVDAAYGPPAIGESPLLTVAADLPGLLCENVDAAMAQVVPAVSAAAAAGGIPFGTVQLECGSAELEAGIAAGAVYQQGWAQAAKALDRLCRDRGCREPSGELHDVYVAFEDSSTVVTVELNDGQQLPPADLVTLQGVVDSLSAAGAANPQLDLNNF